MPWSRAFGDPVPGMKTLRDAAEYITRLPKSEQTKPHWRGQSTQLKTALTSR